MSGSETGQMSAVETSVLSQQDSVEKYIYSFGVCLSSRPPIPFERREGQCHQVLILQQLFAPELRRLTPGILHRSLENPSEPLSASTV